MKFKELALPSFSSVGEVYWVCVKDSKHWLLSSDGDIKFRLQGIDESTREHNQQFWFDYDLEALIAIIKYYRKHDKPFPYAKRISDRFTPPHFHRELLKIFGDDNQWWK